MPDCEVTSGCPCHRILDHQHAACDCTHTSSPPGAASSEPRDTAAHLFLCIILQVPAAVLQAGATFVLDQSATGSPVSVIQSQEETGVFETAEALSFDVAMAAKQGEMPPVILLAMQLHIDCVTTRPSISYSSTKIQSGAQTLSSSCERSYVKHVRYRCQLSCGRHWERCPSCACRRWRSWLPSCWPRSRRAPARPRRSRMAPERVRAACLPAELLVPSGRHRHNEVCHASM